MGFFIVRHRDQHYSLPNTLHDEGCDHILRRAFPIGGSFATARTDWKLCISGVPCLGMTDTPNGPITLSYDHETTYAEITAANEGGACDSTQASLLGYVRKAVTLTVENQGRSVRVYTEKREFANAIPWTPLGSYTPSEFEPPPWSGYPWETAQGYPWQSPTWKSEYFGASVWGDKFTGYPMAASTFSVGAAFIVSTASPAILLCSARFTRCLVIRPGDSLWVQYIGRLRP